MYNSSFECPICGNKQEYEIRNSKNNNGTSCKGLKSVILSSAGDNVFKVACDIKCFKCENTFKKIEDIKFDVT